MPYNRIFWCYMGVLWSYTYKLVPNRNAKINCNIKLTGNYLESLVWFVSIAVAAANQNSGSNCSPRPQFSIVLWRIVLVQEDMSNNKQDFVTFCWPCIPVYLSQYLTNLMHKICFTISFYFMPLHVSSTCAHHQEVKNCITQPLVSSHL